MEEQEKLKISKNNEIKNYGKPVNLKELTEAFDMQSDFLFFYVNQKSGEIVSLTEEEANEDALDDNAKSDEARNILNSDEYIAIPSRWDLNKYQIMVDFIYSLKETPMKDVLARAIQGTGAFGRFKTAIEAYGIQNQWYSFLQELLKQMAIEWCDCNGLLYK